MVTKKNYVIIFKDVLEMKQIKSAKRVSSTKRANGLYNLELRKKGPRFSIVTDKKKENSRNACRKSKQGRI